MDTNLIIICPCPMSHFVSHGDIGSFVSLRETKLLGAPDLKNEMKILERSSKKTHLKNEIEK
jgi:hypothetical protein